MAPDSGFFSPPRAETKDRVYAVSRIKRARATNADMEERAAFIINYARAHGPVTVRQLFYQAVVRGLPGIDKLESGYAKIQRQVLALRRAGRLRYRFISDATRWMRKPDSFDSPQDALRSIAATSGAMLPQELRFGARRTLWPASSTPFRRSMTCP